MKSHLRVYDNLKLVSFSDGYDFLPSKLTDDLRDLEKISFKNKILSRKVDRNGNCFKVNFSNPYEVLLNYPVNIGSNLIYTTNHNSDLLFIGRRLDSGYCLNSFGIPVYPSTYEEIENNLSNFQKSFLDKEFLLNLSGALAGGILSESLFGFVAGGGLTMALTKKQILDRKIETFSNSVLSLYNPNFK